MSGFKLVKKKQHVFFIFSSSSHLISPTYAVVNVYKNFPQKVCQYYKVTYYIDICRLETISLKPFNTYLGTYLKNVH